MFGVHVWLALVANKHNRFVLKSVRGLIPDVHDVSSWDAPKYAAFFLVANASCLSNSESTLVFSLIPCSGLKTPGCQCSHHPNPDLITPLSRFISFVRWVFRRVPVIPSSHPAVRPRVVLRDVRTRRLPVQQVFSHELTRRRAVLNTPARMARGHPDPRCGRGSDEGASLSLGQIARLLRFDGSLSERGREE